MSENKRTLEKYIEGFTKSDHEQVLSCFYRRAFKASQIVGRPSAAEYTKNTAYPAPSAEGMATVA